MASLNTRDAGRDFEGNGPSSFDRRDYGATARDMDLTLRIPGAAEALAEAKAQIERAFSVENHNRWMAKVAGRKEAA